MPQLQPYDRTLLTPPQHTSTTLPNHPLFTRLTRFAHSNPPKPCIRDSLAGTSATHLQLLTDALALRSRLLANLPPSSLEALKTLEPVFIAVLAPGGYEYAVAMLAVLASGAAAVPVSVAVPAAEGTYFVTKARCAGMLVAESQLRLGTQIEKLVKDSAPGSRFGVMAIAPALFSPLLSKQEIKVSADAPLDDSAPGVVIFTSGTTGRPKGSVMRRSYVFADALGVADHYGMCESDVLLHLLPVHHATGVGIMFFPPLVAGAVIEFRSGGFDAGWTWERLGKGGVSVLSAVPTIWMRMRRFYFERIEGGEGEERFVRGARGLRAALCGTSALPEPIANFWTGMLGKKILLRYGATEFGAVFKARLDDPDVPEGSVGTLTAGCDVRLSEGDEGEVLIKSQEMFSGYLNDAEATAAAHTADGYFRSGDIARREGGYYWILGRASVDIIKSGGYKISALDVEREILALPYTIEVMVVGVPDDEFGQRVGAVLVVKQEQNGHEANLGIERLRMDLRDRLAGYKMPTLLRVQQNELPKSGTGKVAKKTLGPLFFPAEYNRIREVQVWSRKDLAVAVKPKL